MLEKEPSCPQSPESPTAGFNTVRCTHCYCCAHHRNRSVSAVKADDYGCKHRADRTSTSDSHPASLHKPSNLRGRRYQPVLRLPHHHSGPGQTMYVTRFRGTCLMVDLEPSWFDLSRSFAWKHLYAMARGIPGPSSMHSRPFPGDSE